MTKRMRWAVAGLAMLAILAATASVMIAKAKRFGKERYYVQIVQPGHPNGNASWGYTYAQPAFDEDGAERRLTFLAEKSLRLRTYLRVYVSGEDWGTAWEEVEPAVVPEPAMRQLQRLPAPAAN